MSRTIRFMKGAAILAALLVLFSCFSIPVPVMAPTGDPVAIQGVGASRENLPNGVRRLHFTVRVSVFTTPLTFNYHWERSDGAKSAVQVRSVEPGTTSVPISTTWDIGPGATVTEVWEQLFVNTGNTHLVSDQVGISLQ